MKYQIYKDQSGQWRWRLKSSNGRIIATASEAYVNKSDCLRSIDIMKDSKSAPVEEA